MSSKFCEFCEEKIRIPCRSQDEANRCGNFIAWLVGIAENYDLDPIGDFYALKDRARR